ncbi:hypothetical protein P8452_44840 [Trifolium repens]|nr:hypothetical protein P8452_44840 [Trifolium repens]
MREKVEREGVGNAFPPMQGAVRLSEYEGRKSDGFVRRLNNEATSFYFTNFPDDVVVVDLWKTFARFGRVGEVYIPSKKDKWGRGFGFVKFFEVENAERLESRLGEVWCGTYKLRINLSRFGRKSKPEPRAQPYKNALTGGEGSEAGGGGGKVMEWGGRKGVQGVVKTVGKAGVSLDLEPDMEFVYALENSSVGKMIKGKNIKQVQFNLCMEGYRNIRVASLGEGWAVVFSESGGDVGLALNNKVWWEGYMEEFRPWSPLMAASRREIWVRIYGVPLQLWHEPVFKTILKTCGEVIGMDEDTRGRSRFDVARVKLLVPVLGDIDFSQEISSQGLKFMVRVVEERGGPLEFVHVPYMAEQQRWSEAGSSCDSGERCVRRAEEAMAEGGAFGGSVSGDSDGTEQGQLEEAVGVQSIQKCMEDKRNTKKKTQVSFGRAEEIRPIPSKSHAEKTKGGENKHVDGIKAKCVRGLAVKSIEGCDKVGEVCFVGVDQTGEVGCDLVGQGSEVAIFNSGELEGNGPAELGPLLQAGSSTDQGEGERVPQTMLTGQVEGNTVIDKLDLLVDEARSKKHVTNLGQNFTLDESNLSSSSCSMPNLVKQNRLRKPLSRLPFPGMVGPKCLRLVEMVNSVGATSRRKKGSREDMGDGILMNDDKGEEESHLPMADNSNPNTESPLSEGDQRAITGGNVLNSGVNFIMGEEDLENVDDFEVKRQGAEAKCQEAELILEIQADLGLNFVAEKEELVEHLVILEERDREKLDRNEERQGFQ